MFSLSSKGDFNNTMKFLRKAARGDVSQILGRYAERGVEALASATPKDSGQTALSWGYTVKQSRGSYEIHWTNKHINDGVNIAIILQYGHGTGTGGYVAGRDYINPAIRPVFDKIAQEAWKEVAG